MMTSALLGLIAAAGLAFENNTAGNTAQFLQLGAGARPLGLGDAYGPVAEGPDAVYWNPAGLAQMTGPAFSYTRTELMLSLHHDYASYAHPIKLLRGTVGAGFTHFSQDHLPVITNANLRVAESFRPYSDAFSLAYATKFDLQSSYDRSQDYFRDTWFVPRVDRPLHQGTDEWTGTLMLGLAMKVVNQTVYQRRAFAFAWDGGVLFRPTQIRRLSLSATFRNAGTQSRFNKVDESLPLEFGAGAAYDWRFGDERLLASAELAIPYYGVPHGKLGAEFTHNFSKHLAASLRAGYKTQTSDGADLGPLTGITAGVGARWKRLTADLAFQPLAEFGEQFRMSAGMRW